MAIWRENNAIVVKRRRIIANIAEERKRMALGRMAAKLVNLLGEEAGKFMRADAREQPARIAGDGGAESANVCEAAASLADKLTRS